MRFSPNRADDSLPHRTAAVVRYTKIDDSTSAVGQNRPSDAIRSISA